MAQERMKDFKTKYTKLTPWWKIINQEFKLTAPYQFQTDIRGFVYSDRKVSINSGGIVTIFSDFYWSASGLTIDTDNSRRASCEHDATFYLSDKGVFRGLLSEDIRNLANDKLLSTLREDGMSYIRANTWYQAVDKLGSSYWEKTG
jgi:hypothetical protein